MLSYSHFVQTIKTLPDIVMDNVELLLEYLSDRAWKPVSVFHKYGGVQLCLRTIGIIADWPPYPGK